MCSATAAAFSAVIPLLFCQLYNDPAVIFGPDNSVKKCLVDAIT
jgi:hypothetical protein